MTPYSTITGFLVILIRCNCFCNLLLLLKSQKVYGICKKISLAHIALLNSMPGNKEHWTSALAPKNEGAGTKNNSNIA